MFKNFGMLTFFFIKYYSKKNNLTGKYKYFINYFLYEINYLTILFD